MLVSFYLVAQLLGILTLDKSNPCLTSGKLGDDDRIFIHKTILRTYILTGKPAGNPVVIRTSDYHQELVVWCPNTIADQGHILIHVVSALVLTVKCC